MMKQVNVPVKDISQFSGQWVAIDPTKQRVVAAGETLKEIAPFVSGKKTDQRKISAAAFKVPRKDEGPYVLVF